MNGGRLVAEADPDGPLAAYGLVSDPELAKTQEMVKNRTPMAALN